MERYPLSRSTALALVGPNMRNRELANIGPVIEPIAEE